MTYDEVTFKIYIKNKKEPIEERKQLRHNEQIPIRMRELVDYGVYMPNSPKHGVHTWIPPHQIIRVEYTIQKIEG